MITDADGRIAMFPETDSGRSEKRISGSCSLGLHGGSGRTNSTLPWLDTSCADLTITSWHAVQRNVVLGVGRRDTVCVSAKEQ